MLEVTIGIMAEPEEDQESEEVEERVFAYPLSTSVEEVAEKVQLFINLYNEEVRSAVKDKERSDNDKQADEVIEALTGAEFNEKI